MGNFRRVEGQVSMQTGIAIDSKDNFNILTMKQSLSFLTNHKVIAIWNIIVLLVLTATPEGGV